MDVTRRDFIKIASASAAGLAALGLMPALTRGDVGDTGLERMSVGIRHRVDSVGRDAVSWWASKTMMS